MMIGRNKTAWAVCLALLGTAFATQAVNNHGTNRKVMTGAQCQPSIGTQWGDFLINPDGLRNISANNRYVSCALVLDADGDYDQADSDSTTDQGSWTIEVGLDYSGIGAGVSRTTNCTLFRRDWNGIVQTEAFSVTANGGAGTQYASLTPTILTGASPFNPDTVSINCRLAPQIKLSFLKTYERMKTDGYSYTP